MSKIELNPLVSGNSVSVLNNNFQKIEDALNDKVLYRDNPPGETNQMQNDLDMNGNRIYNLPAPKNENEPARLKDLLDQIGGGDDGSVFNSIVEVWRYGAIGDGVTDDTDALQAAIEAAYGKILLLEDKEYKITRELVIEQGLHIFGNGARINGSSMPQGTGLNRVRAIYVKGVADTTDIPVTASINKGTFVLNCDTSGLNKHDIFVLRNDEPMVTGYGNPASKKGQLSSVGSITNSNELVMGIGADFTYDHTQNLRLNRVVPCRYVVIQDLEIVMKGYQSVHGGIRLDYCTDFRIQNVTMRGVEDHGIATWYCMDGVIDQCKVYDATSAYLWNPAWNTGYAFVFYNATRNVVLQNSFCYNCRRGNTGGNELPAQYITIQNNYAMGGDNGFGTHEPCFNWTIKNNYGTGLAQNFIQIRGSNHLVQGNRVVGCGKQGIRVRTYYDDPTGIHDVYLIDNHLENCGETGIWLDGIDPVNDAPSNGGPVGKIVIRGGSIINPVYNGIYITQAHNVNISDVLFNGAQIPGATDGNGIYINSSDVENIRPSNIHIRNCQFRNLPRNAVRCDYSDYITVESCIMEDFTVDTTSCNGVDFRYCSNIKLLNNKIDMSANGYYAVYIDQCDNIAIEGGDYKVKGVLLSNDAIVILRTDTGSLVDRTQNVSIRGVNISGSNRYGILIRYANIVALNRLYLDNCGTIRFKDCSDVRVTDSYLKATPAQLYCVLMEDCSRLQLTNCNLFPSSNGVGAGVYCRLVDSVNKMQMALIQSCIFGQFADSTGVILQDVNYPQILGNNFVLVPGIPKVSITGALKMQVSNNIPGHPGLWRQYVTGTSVTAIGDANYFLQNPNKTTVTFSSQQRQTRIQVTVMNGRVDNEIIDANGYTFMGLPGPYVIDAAYAAPEFELVETDWRLVNA